MKKLLFYTLMLLAAGLLEAQSYELVSPDQMIKVVVNTPGGISFTVNYKGSPVIENTTLDLELNGAPLFGSAPKVKKKQETQHNAILKPEVAQKSMTIKDEYKELILLFQGDKQLTFRAYNDGVAYRISTSLKGEVVVNQEMLTLNFSGQATSLFPEEETLISHYERLYKPVQLDTLKTSTFCSLPVLMQVQKVNVLFTEADLFDYPGMFMYGTKGNALKAGFPKYVTEAKPMPGAEDRNQILTSADYIAKTSGTRDYPWRLMVITDQDGKLVESNLVYQLSRPSKIGNADWIKPGKVAWDWYNANNIYGVDFKSGLNTETYKYYIDFASEYGLDYIILDEGWTKTTTNIRESNPDIDVKELIAYGKSKNVGVILWLLWGPLDKDLSVLELYKTWGVKGIKVDFMQRADQYMVNFYERVAAEGAKHQLMVDYHGAYKPAGLRRAYPNVISYEGVKGNENNKWSQDISPEHNVTLPFTRMVAGPMDFTPGAMINTTVANHRISFDRPMALGTRSHQVAMYVVFESPLQMLCDAPSTYYREAETTRFIAQMPTVWDETKVLDAKVADYILIARKQQDKWYIGAMTDWTARTLNLDLAFLETGNYTLEIMQDGPNADRYAQDYQHLTQDVTNKTQLKLNLAAGGGWVGVLTKK